MLIKFMLVFIFLIQSCTTPSGKFIKSEWEPLKRADSFQCEIWPLKKDDFDVTRVFQGSKSGSLLGEIVSRSGVLRYEEMIPSKLLKVKEDEITSIDSKINFEPKDVINFQGGYFFVNETDDGAVDLSYVRENRVDKKQFKNEEFRWIHATKSAVFLSTKKEKKTVVRVLEAKSGKISQKKVIAFNSDVDVFRDDKASLEFVATESAVSRIGSKGGLMGKAYKLNAPQNKIIFKSYKNRIYFAYVSGDSFLGEDSNIVVVNYENGLWKEKKIDLQDSNVVRIAWADMGDNLQILAEKQLESDSTIASYSVLAKNEKKPFFKGVLGNDSKLTRIIDGDGVPTFFIVKQRIGRTSQTQICI